MANTEYEAGVSCVAESREFRKDCPEVHVAGMCVDITSYSELRVLIAKRSSYRAISPNRYEGCGGRLAFGESFAEGVVRHYETEMGISVRVLPSFCCVYEIREVGIPLIPGVRFLCERRDSRIPYSPNHDEIKWVSEAELRNLDDGLFIPGLKDQFLELLDRYQTAPQLRHGLRK